MFASRVKDWQAHDLDVLCQTGRLVWQRVGSVTETSAQWHSLASMPLSFFSRQDSSLGITREERARLLGQWTTDSPERRILNCLQERGALFMEDISAQLTGILPVHQEQAMLNLIRAGLIWADAFSVVRVLCQKPAHRYRLMKKARQHGAPGYLSMAGRWVLVETRAADAVELAQWWATALLDRYGVVFKAVYDKERPPVAWRELLFIYNRMEARRELAAGRFVEGFSGMQYALPEAVGELQKAEPASARALPDLPAKDPATMPIVGDRQVTADVHETRQR